MSSQPGAEQNIDQKRLEDAIEKIDELAQSEQLTERVPDEEIVERYVDDVGSRRDTTTRDKRRTWKYFLEYFEECEIEYLSEINSGHIERFKDHLYKRGDKKDYTVKKHLERLKQILDFAERRNWVSADKIGDWDQYYPDIDIEEKRRDETLLPERGNEILEWVSEERYAQRPHVIWILIWELGLRKSACLALDRDHFHSGYDNCDCGDRSTPVDGPHLLLRNRPEIDLGLKKRGNTEPEDRCLPLTKEQGRAIQRYLDTNPPGDSDENEPQGLLQSRDGSRLGESGFYRSVCRLTSPAKYTGKCNCRYCRQRDGNLTIRDGYKCEQSRCPHACRHGAITEMFNQAGENEQLSAEDISHVVGTGVAKLRKIYDRASMAEKFNRHADDFREAMK